MTTSPTPLTLPAARKAVRWFQKAMRMRDWEIHLEIQDDPPEWTDEDRNSRTAGMCSRQRRYKIAWLWVSNRACRNEGGDRSVDPLVALFHELVHVASSEGCWAQDHEEVGEFVVERLARLITTAYRAAQKYPKAFGNG